MTTERGESRSPVACSLRLGLWAGAVAGALESVAGTAWEVALKRLYVQDRLGAWDVLVSLTDLAAVPKAIGLYALVGGVSGIGLGAAATLARRRGGAPRRAARADVLGAWAGAMVFGGLSLGAIRGGGVGALWPLEQVGLVDVLVSLLGAAIAALLGWSTAGVAERALARERLVRAAHAGGRVIATLVALAFVGGAVGTWAAGDRTRPTASSTPGETRDPRPDLVLIVLDTVRADRLSLYGHPRPTSPRLARLAERGVVYEHAWSPAPWTLPAHGSMFTGELPHRHGAHWGPLALDPDVPTLAERLREAGYRTAAFTNNPWIGPTTGLDRGFDELHGLWRTHGGVWDRLVLVRVGRRLVGWDPDEGAARTVHEVGRWLEHADRQPFFLFVNFMEAHDPNWPAPEADRFLPPGTTRSRLKGLNQNPYRWFAGAVDMTPDDFDLLADLYDAQLAYLDARLGQLVDRLVAARGWERLAIAVVGDHGESLGEHGAMSHVFSLGEPLLHVPLVLVTPADGSRAGTRVATPVSTADLAPTLEALGRAQPAGRPGRAGVDLGAGPPPTDRVVIAENYRPRAILDILRAIDPDVSLAPFDRSLVAGRLGAHKIVTASDGMVRYTELVRDPLEHADDPGAVPPEVRTRLREALAPSEQAVHGAAGGAAVPPDLDPDEKRRLQELGYFL